MKMYRNLGCGGLLLLLVIAVASRQDPRAGSDDFMPKKSVETTSETDVPRPVQPPASSPVVGVTEVERGLPDGHASDIDRLRAWAREAPDEALLWVATAPAGSERDAVLELVCAEVVRFAPAEAVRLSESYAGSNYHLRENLLHQWAVQDQEAAATYARQQPAGEFRNRLLGRIALTQAVAHPEDAAMLVAEEMEPGEVRNETRLSVLRLWAERNPRAARAWMESFDEPRLRKRAQREVSRQPIGVVGPMQYESRTTPAITKDRGEQQ